MSDVQSQYSCLDFNQVFHVTFISFIYYFLYTFGHLPYPDQMETKLIWNAGSDSIYYNYVAPQDCFYVHSLSG